MSEISNQSLNDDVKQEFNSNSEASRSTSKETPSKSKLKRKKYPSPITFRPTDEERAMLKADAGGMSQSAYIRKCLFGKKAAKRVVPEADRVLLAQILAKLGETRIPNNLNQIAYHANCGSLLLDDVTVEEINEACLHVAWMRTQLIEALGLMDKSKKSQSGLVKQTKDDFA